MIFKLYEILNNCYQKTIMINGQGVTENTRTDAAEVQTTDAEVYIFIIYLWLI